MIGILNGPPYARHAAGAALLPPEGDAGYVENDGDRIWHAAYRTGRPLVLPHGGLGNSRNWGYQVSALTALRYRSVVIDTLGHGRSTRDARPYTYELLARDVVAVMDRLGIERAALVGWSDGACTAMILSALAPSRFAGVLCFACNMDPSGTEQFQLTPVIERCTSRHKKDSAELSSTPGGFDELAEAVGLMQRTQPDWTPADLARVDVPVTILHSENDEFIKRDHSEYLARTIPGAGFAALPGVSHFAPLQRPNRFNRVMLHFLARIFERGNGT